VEPGAGLGVVEPGVDDGEGEAGFEPLPVAVAPFGPALGVGAVVQGAAAPGVLGVIVLVCGIVPGVVGAGVVCGATL
jgi:hypothetical protein